MAPMSIPIAVPSGPAFGRNELPGSTKHPHPIIAPKARPHTSMGRMAFLSVPLEPDITGYY